MYALHNNRVIGPTWNIIRKLKQGPKAKIKTKDGITREINIKDKEVSYQYCNMPQKWMK